MNDVSERPIMRVTNQKAQLALGTEFGQIGCNRQKKKTKNAYDSRLMNNLQCISPEERWQAIAVMAYDLARMSDFVGEAAEYWLAAEAKVDAELAVQQSAM